jgi:putative tricarboxylic transport membrane protein
LIAQTDVGVLRYFFTGTINMIIIALCALSVSYSVFSEIRTYQKHRKKQMESEET